MSSSKINFDAYIEAIKRCKIDNEPVKSTAKAYGVPRSSLMCYLKKVDEQLGDISNVEDGVLLDFMRRCTQRVPSNQIFTLNQEDELVKYVLKCVRHCNGFSINELKEWAYQFAKKLDVDYPASWDEDGKAGWHWYYKFMARHPQLVLRMPEQTSMNRFTDVCETNVKPSTSRTTSMSRLLIFDAVDPLQGVDPLKLSNRGRKPLRSDFLNSSPVLAATKAAKTTLAKQSSKRVASAAPSAKRGKSTAVKPSTRRASVKKAPSESSDDDDEDRDFCIICKKLLPIWLTAKNSIACNTCHRPVHLRCADLHAGYYTCKHCDSDVDDE